MVKRITQSTFDDAVKENMEEFDISMESAINDTVDQFVGQGVNLGTWLFFIYNNFVYQHTRKYLNMINI